jgi:GGDEF domain-containing protein
MGERFRRSIQQASWTLRPITANIGVATLTPDMAQREALVLQADKSLYYAKKTGATKSRICKTKMTDDTVRPPMNSSVKG